MLVKEKISGCRYTCWIYIGRVGDIEGVLHEYSSMSMRLSYSRNGGIRYIATDSSPCSGMCVWLTLLLCVILGWSHTCPCMGSICWSLPPNPPHHSQRLRGRTNFPFLLNPMDFSNIHDFLIKL